MKEIYNHLHPMQVERATYYFETHESEIDLTADPVQPEWKNAGNPAMWTNGNWAWFRKMVAA